MDTPAFPCKEWLDDDRPTTRNPVLHKGMTLRDYFAAKAMAGFNKGMVDYGWDKEVLDAHAKQAYAIADAMLKARES